MPSIHFTAKSARLAALALALCAGTALVTAGPLDPPSGPVVSTFKTLTEVQPRVAINGENTAGDQDSLFRITSGGSYYLTGSYTVLSGRSFLEIAASNVTVDLNGFRVNGLAGSLDGITLGPGVNNVRIINGHLTGFGGDGVDTGDVGGATGVHLRDITVSSVGGFGFRVGPTGVITDCMATGAGTGGFNLAGGVVAERCTAKSNTGAGFFASGAAHMTRCVARENTTDGFRLSSSATVEHCESLNNTGTGVSAITGSNSQRIVGNTISGNTANGMFLASAALVRDNVVNQTAAACVLIYGAGNRVEGNTLRNAGTVGIGLSAAAGATPVDNLIVSNFFYSNGDATNGFASIAGSSNNQVGPVVNTGGTLSTTSPYANFNR